MCGRITQDLTLTMLFDRYRLSRSGKPPAPNVSPRYNGCPTQDFVAVRREGEEPTLAKLRWGFVPAWARDVKMGARMINARSETVHEKPAFRVAFRRRRCAVPVNGWFEWRRENGAKQPYWLRPSGAEMFSLAGLWERWEKGDEPVETFTVLTTAASPALADIHHRQPVIVEDAVLDEWLDPGTSSERLLALAGAANEGPFDTRAVSSRVNSTRNDDAELLEPL